VSRPDQRSDPLTDVETGGKVSIPGGQSIPIEVTDMAETQTKGHQSFRQAAEQILRQAGTPLKADEIVKRAITDGLIATSGKTPVATMGAQLYTEIQQRGEASVFVRAGRGLFGLRAWGGTHAPTTKKTVGESGRVVPISIDPVERLIAEVMTAQYESFNSVHFEKVLTEAFGMLGFDAHHVGGAGRTDILLNAAVSAASYRVVIDAKSNKNGKIGDQNIDRNSLDDHRKAEGAHAAMVVAPDFSGGNLLKRANDYGVALLTATSLADLLRLHRRTPFTFVDLRPLFETHGRTGEVVEQLRQVSQAMVRRWGLLRELIEVIEQLPTGVFADAQKLWLLLSFQQRENAPSQEAVEDALAVLSSRLLGVLKAVNGGQEYALTMTPAMAISRLRALADLLAPVSVPANAAVDQPAIEAPEPSLAPGGAQMALPDVDAAGLPDFVALQSEIVRQLEAVGLSDPRVVSKRHVVLRRRNQTVGLAFRTSKCYPGRGWWWTFTKASDAAALAECDRVVLVGLMADPEKPNGVRDEVVFIGWDEAAAIAARGKATAWTRQGRIHVYAGKGGPWEPYVQPHSNLNMP
jgi:hypothetical protein